MSLKLIASFLACFFPGVFLAYTGNIQHMDNRCKWSFYPLFLHNVSQIVYSKVWWILMWLLIFLVPMHVSSQILHVKICSLWRCLWNQSFFLQMSAMGVFKESVLVEIDSSWFNSDMARSWMLMNSTCGWQSRKSDIFVWIIGFLLGW